MSTKITKPKSLTIGQLARRWAVSRDRVQRLVDAGFLPGAFRIPSAGRYAATVKIPIATVLKVESNWQVAPDQRHRVPPVSDAGSAGLQLRHFPELTATPPPACESHEDARH
jgi:hypothetical protein